MKERETLVHVARAAVAGPGEVLVALGLGSCVAILLHDREVRIAGMAHSLLPEAFAGRSTGHEAKFVDTAVPHLVECMERLGAQRARMVARLVGGASMFGALLTQGSVHTGVRNVAAARRALEAAGIAIVGEEVGREHGRSVRFHPADGRAVVTSYHFGEVVL